MWAALVSALFGNATSGGGPGCGPMAVAQAAAGLSSNEREPLDVEEKRANLEGTIDILDKSIKALDGRVKKKQLEMKGFRETGQTQRALQSLGQIKKLQAQLQSVIGQHGNAVTMLDQINSNALSEDVVSAMRGATQILQQQARSTSVQDADAVMMDAEDNLNLVDEVNAITSKPLGSGAHLTEADLDAELAYMDDPEFSSKPLILPSPPMSTPSQPIMGGGVPKQKAPAAVAAAMDGGSATAMMLASVPRPVPAAAAASSPSVPTTASSLYTESRPTLIRAPVPVSVSTAPLLNRKPTTTASLKTLVHADEDPAMRELDDAIKI